MIIITDLSLSKSVKRNLKKFYFFS
uniref:Uncharacterized protein n=1 Tax=Anguilla anguilla TaxID=7936 RepID=A0A0E9VR63_ANGAN